MNEYLVYTILIGTIGENVFQLDESLVDVISRIVLFGVRDRIKLNRHIRDERPNRHIRNHRPNVLFGTRDRIVIFGMIDRMSYSEWETESSYSEW